MFGAYMVAVASLPLVFVTRRSLQIADVDDVIDEEAFDDDDVDEVAGNEVDYPVGERVDDRELVTDDS